MSEKNMLSVIVVAKNEEAKIVECFKSVEKLADEIVLIDSGSTDKTKAIAREFKAKIFDFKGGSYADWRNEGLKMATGKWVLYIDADERTTPEMCDEITQLVNKSVGQFSVYAIPRRNIILGREMKHGGWWPDYVKRLYLKAKLTGWKGKLHEEPIFDGEMGYLTNGLIHLKHSNLSEMVDKTNIWSEVEAKLMFDAKHPPMNVIRFASAMFREFWLRMVKHKAFLDGRQGVIYALYQVWSKFISYAKLWEMQLKTNDLKLKT